mmetsp:Transcript_16644/g.52414  ORF Transcript_16644/g.52414 Transcript_16644/m.52414 type:complete len:281 (+) Transcript_16644:297-1139(+)
MLYVSPAPLRLSWQGTQWPLYLPRGAMTSWSTSAGMSFTDSSVASLSSPILRSLSTSMLALYWKPVGADGMKMLYELASSPSPMTVQLIHVGSDSLVSPPSSSLPCDSTCAFSPARNMALLSLPPMTAVSWFTLLAFSLTAMRNSAALSRPSPSVSYWLKRAFDSAFRSTRAGTAGMSLWPLGAEGTWMLYVSSLVPLLTMVQFTHVEPKTLTSRGWLTWKAACAGAGGAATSAVTVCTSRTASPSRPYGCAEADRAGAAKAKAAARRPCSPIGRSGFGW